MSFPRDFSPEMTVFLFLCLGAYATQVSGVMGRGASVVTSIDADCSFLELYTGEGWWCCANRTLSVQHYAVVGRRHGVTGPCASFRASRATEIPQYAGASRGLGFLGSLIIATCVAVCAFAMCAVPIIIIFRLCRRRAARKHVRMAVPIFRSDDTESGDYDYLDVGPVTIVHQL